MIFVFILGANMYFSSYMFLLLYSLFPSTHYYLLFLSPLNSEYFGWLFVYIYIISLYLPCLMLLIQKLIFFVFASMIEEKKMSYKKENQTEIIIGHIFLKEHNRKIPFELDISTSPISVAICGLVAFFLVLLNLFIMLASVSLLSSLASCKS